MNKFLKQGQNYNNNIGAVECLSLWGFCTIKASFVQFSDGNVSDSYKGYLDR